MWEITTIFTANLLSYSCFVVYLFTHPLQREATMAAMLKHLSGEVLPRWPRFSRHAPSKNKAFKGVVAGLSIVLQSNCDTTYISVFPHKYWPAVCHFQLPTYIPRAWSIQPGSTDQRYRLCFIIIMHMRQDILQQHQSPILCHRVAGSYHG